MNKVTWRNPIAPTHRRVKAFTLIELIVAIVLASLMMVTLIRVVERVAIENRQLKRQQTDLVAIGILADRLREDLINARGMRLARNRIELFGFVGDRKRPGKVDYVKQNFDGRDLLIRREGGRRELLWVGVGNILLEPLESEDEQTIPLEGAGGLPSAPSLLRVTMTDGNGRILFRELVRHHAS